MEASTPKLARAHASPVEPVQLTTKPALLVPVWVPSVPS